MVVYDFHTVHPRTRSGLCIRVEQVVTRVIALGFGKMVVISNHLLVVVGGPVSKWELGSDRNKGCPVANGRSLRLTEYLYGVSEEKQSKNFVHKCVDLSKEGRNPPQI